MFSRLEACSTGARRLVHPAERLLDLVEVAPCGLGEGIDVEGDVVVDRDERGRGNQVAQVDPAGAPRGAGIRPAALAPLVLELAAVRGRRCSAQEPVAYWSFEWFRVRPGRWGRPRAQDWH